MKPIMMDQNRSRTVLPNQQHDLAVLHQDSDTVSQPEPTLYFMTFKSLFPMAIVEFNQQRKTDIFLFA